MNIQTNAESALIMFLDNGKSYLCPGSHSPCNNGETLAFSYERETCTDVEVITERFGIEAIPGFCYVACNWKFNERRLAEGIRCNLRQIANFYFVRSRLAIAIAIQSRETLCGIHY